MALAEMGNRTTISSINPPDGSQASLTAALFYTPKTQALLRAALWGFARRTLPLTLLKSVITPAGLTSATPPPQPFSYEYAYPSDCLRARFLFPAQVPQVPGIPLTTATNVQPPYWQPPTRIPYVESIDVDAQGNASRVILTNLANASLVYTADVSQFPDLFDPLFVTALTATLAAFFIQALSQNTAQMNQQIGLAKGALDAARAQNASESMPTADLVVDWMRARQSSGGAWSNGNGSGWAGDYSSLELPGGLRY